LPECSADNTVHGVITISLKVPDTLDSRLAEEAQLRRTSKSAVIRECVEKMLLAPRKNGAASCLDLAGDLAGCLKGPPDIATNLEDLEDRRELATAKKRNAGKPGTPLRQAARELGL
jgi:hypothetical protein